MPMALTERERGFGASLLDRVSGTLAVTRRHLEGPARLIFTDQRSFSVEAQVQVLRSAFSSWGDGYIRCPEAIGFEALDSSDWLTLSFAGAAAVEIEVLDVKARDGQCRCRFEVRS